MNIKFVNIGFGNIIAANRVIAIISARATSIEDVLVRRIVQKHTKNGTLINATGGRNIESILFTDSKQVILSAIKPEIIADKVSANYEKLKIQELQEEEYELY